MPATIDQRDALAAALKAFDGRPVADAAQKLFATLGYTSDRRLPITSAQQFGTQLDPNGKLTDHEHETLAQLTSLHLLFQLTGAELDTHRDLLDDSTAVHVTKIESYLFFAAELPPGQYPRTALSALVRAINKPLPMPALVLFRHGDSVSIGIIHRRLHQRDQARDVLEKVTLIKDIAFADPIRAHVEILNDFVLANLAADFGVANFVRLHEAWQRRLGSYALSNDFYREIADWYFWAHHQVDDGAIRLPRHCDTEQEKSLFLIRLLTRVIFCWFLVEKRLIPTDLFREHRLQALLKDFKSGTDNPVGASPGKKQTGLSAPLLDTAPSYYRAVLQNLFFGTLNMPPEQREFRKRSPSGGRDQNFGITNLWRYETAFRNATDWTAIARRIPFLNGGLFDCLDDKSGKKPDNFILDGFSDREDHSCHLPNDLFFGPERTVDLSTDYGEEEKRTARSKKAKVRGLIEILSRYKFTIEENTPLEAEIALDPELLGKVFENLLASYNEDTRTTARKALGAFYTPREIVSYMVDEALKSYLKTSVAQTILSGSSVKPFNPTAATTKTRRNLPHWTQEGTTYWVTFRLADSLPAAKLKAWQEEKANWLSHNPEPWDEAQWAEYDERFGQRLEAWLDAGEGECHLRRPAVRAIVEKCLFHFDGQRYDLPAWVVMPNHVHLLIRPLEGRTLSKILQGIKGVSAKECNQLLGRTGETFWQDESFDHIVRSQVQFDRFVRYIAENPVKARLRDGEFSVAQTILSGHQCGTDNPVSASETKPQTILSGHQCGTDNPVSIPESKTQTGLSGLLSRQIDDLFSHKATLKEIKPDTRDALIAAIGRVKILDPACGSGAFPMGALHRLVDLLQKLDPNNESWKRDRLAEARRYRQLLEESGAASEEIAACDARIADIEKSFDTRFHALDFARKLYLIENSIYGVDIQPIATQIAKLRFFISLVVDQRVAPTILSGSGELTDNPVGDLAGRPQTGLSGLPWNLGIRPLPNLETKFVAADTLIPIEKSESDLFSGEIDRLRAELAAIRHEHFNARSPAAKRKWRDADAAKRQEIAALLEREHAVPRAAARKLAAWDPYDQNEFAPFFDSEWMFGLPIGKVRIQGKAPATLLGNLALINETGGQTELTPTALREIDSGFDIVIGNPPYVRQEQLKHLKEQFKRHYECFTGTADLYVFFYEAGIKLLRCGGTFSFITSNKWFRVAYGEKLRSWLTKNTRVLQLIDFGDAAVFTAIAYPCIVIAQRTDRPVGSDASFRALNWELGPPTEIFPDVFAKKSFTQAQKDLTSDCWRFDSRGNLRLLDRLREAGKPLGEYVGGRGYWGVKTGLNEAFVVDRATRDRLIDEHPSSADVLKSFLRGRDVKRWRVDSQDLWLIFTRRGIEIKKYPAIFNHLKPFKTQLMPGGPGGRKPGTYEWYEIQDNIAYWQQFAQPKIIVPAISGTVNVAVDFNGYFANNKASIFVSERARFLAGIVNSPVAFWFTQQVFATKQGGFFDFEPRYSSQWPIPAAAASQQATIEGLVDYLLFLNRHFADHPAEQTPRDPLMLAYWERVLNGLVYELYFPEEVQGAGLRLFDLVAQAQLPHVARIKAEALAEGKSEADTDRIVCATLRTLFEALHDGTHPLRIALDKLQTLDTVRIIESKA